MYDAKGQDVALTYYFQKAATDTWNVFATANGSTWAAPPAAPAPITTINFPQQRQRADRAGRRRSRIDMPASTNAAGATPADHRRALDLSGVTQFGSAFGVTDIRRTAMRRAS